MALPLHSIVLPRRCLHVDDKRNILLAGCGPYVDIFDLSPSPVLRARLGVFTRNCQDVEGLVRVKDSLHFLVFSRSRLAILHEDNLKNGGIISYNQISEFLVDIRQVLEAQLVQGRGRSSSSLLLFSSAVSWSLDDTRRDDSMISAAWKESSSTAFTLRSSGSIIRCRNLVSGEVEEAVVSDTEHSKSLLLSNLPGHAILAVDSSHRRFIYAAAIEKRSFSCDTDGFPCPTEKKEGVLPTLLALSEDYKHAAVANSDKSIECTRLDVERRSATTSTKQFVVASAVTSLAIGGRGKNTMIYYGTETGELSCIPVSFYNDDNSLCMIAGISRQSAAGGDGPDTRGDVRAKGVIGYGLLNPYTWLVSDGSVYSSSRNCDIPERIGVRGAYRSIVSLNADGYGIMAAFSYKHLLVCTGTIVKEFSLTAVNLAAVAVLHNFVCLQSRDGILVLLDLHSGTSTRFKASQELAGDRTKLGRMPRLTQIVTRLKNNSAAVEFVVGFDNGTAGILCMPPNPGATKVGGTLIDSLFSSGKAGSLMKIADECTGATVVSMGRYGHRDHIYTLMSDGFLYRLDVGKRDITNMRLGENVAMERILCLTPLPDGDLLVCGIREGVLVGVSLSSLRLVFSLSHRRNLLTRSISQCTVLLEDNKFRIAALDGQTLVVAEEPWYGQKTKVERALHSAKIVAHTSVYIGFGGNEVKASYESGHAVVTASADGHVVVSSLWSNGRLVPLHRFRAPGVNCIAAFSYASQRCASCVKAEIACSHRNTATAAFRWVFIVAGTNTGSLYCLSFDAASISNGVLDRPSAHRTSIPGFEDLKSLLIGARPSLHGLVRATLFVRKESTFGEVEVSAMHKAEPFNDVTPILDGNEQVARAVREGIVAFGFKFLADSVLPAGISGMDVLSILTHPLVHHSADVLAGTKATVVHNRFAYTSASLHPREGALIGTKDGAIYVWGIVDAASPEKHRQTTSLARRGDPTLLPSEDGAVEGKEAKWGVIAYWTPSKEYGEVVALSSTLSPSSAATTIAALFSTGKVAVFLLALDKLIFMQNLEVTVKDPVGISICLQGRDNLNSRCYSPYPSSAVVSGGNSIEVVRICLSALRKAVKKVWDDA